MKFTDIIRKSLYKSTENEMTPSSSRIFGYVMMLVIFILGITHTGIEIGNAIIVWRLGNGSVYIPSWQSITIIGMWLAHQLTLLGIYKGAESQTDIKKIGDISESNANQ
jgi:hypothetical protein